MHQVPARSLRASCYCLTLCCGLALAAPLRAQAAALSWNNGAGGPASTSTNWTPNAVPGGADDLTFNLGGSYTVSWNASVTSSRTHTYRNGAVTNSLSSPHAAGLGLTIGDLAADVASMTLTTGTLTSSANVVVGDAASSMGTLNVNDDDADLIVAGGADLILGNSGDAAMNITGSGRIEVADQFIAGSNSTSSPVMTISGFTVAPLGASSLEVLGTSQSRIGAGGDAALTISTGAAASFAGDLVIANGSASNSNVTVETAGLLNARLIVDGDLLVGRNTSAAIAAGVGTLEINTGGTATVDGDTFLGDPDGGTGSIIMGGGTFVGGSPVQMLNGSAITGTGTVNADVTVGAGSIVATTAAGLTFGGIISNTGAGIFGTKIHFASSGGYSGSGNCQVDITGDVGATITATGTLSIGDNTTSGFSYNGAISVGTQDVTLVDSNGAVLGGLTTIAPAGDMTCTNGIGLALSGRIQGEGTLHGNVTAAGTLDPQRSPTPGGIMAIDGNLQMNPSGTYDMDLGGTPASNMHDRLSVSGTAAFDGTLRVKLPTGYVPKVGEQFIAINATLGRSGEFASSVPPSPSPCNNVTFVLVYSSTAAIVLVRPPLGCTALGDLNSDGGCNGPDIQPFINAILIGPYNSCADLNGDCANTVADIPIFVNCLL